MIIIYIQTLFLGLCFFTNVFAPVGEKPVVEGPKTQEEIKREEMQKADQELKKKQQEVDVLNKEERQYEQQMYSDLAKRNKILDKTSSEYKEADKGFQLSKENWIIKSKQKQQAETQEQILIEKRMKLNELEESSQRQSFFSRIVKQLDVWVKKNIRIPFNQRIATDLPAVRDLQASLISLYSDLGPEYLLEKAKINRALVRTIADADIALKKNIDILQDYQKALQSGKVTDAQKEEIKSVVQKTVSDLLVIADRVERAQNEEELKKVEAKIEEVLDALGIEGQERENFEHEAGIPPRTAQSLEKLTDEVSAKLAQTGEFNKIFSNPLSEEFSNFFKDVSRLDRLQKSNSPLLTNANRTLISKVVSTAYENGKDSTLAYLTKLSDLNTGSEQQLRKLSAQLMRFTNRLPDAKMYEVESFSDAIKNYARSLTTAEKNAVEKAGTITQPEITSVISDLGLLRNDVLRSLSKQIIGASYTNLKKRVDTFLEKLEDKAINPDSLKAVTEIMRDIYGQINQEITKQSATDIKVAQNKKVAEVLGKLQRDMRDLASRLNIDMGQLIEVDPKTNEVSNVMPAAPPPPPPVFDNKIAKVTSDKEILSMPPKKPLPETPSKKDDLFAQLKKGLNLKKVESIKKNEEPKGLTGTLARAMEERRKRIQESAETGEEPSEEEEDNDDWG